LPATESNSKNAGTRMSFKNSNLGAYVMWALQKGGGVRGIGIESSWPRYCSIVMQMSASGPAGAKCRYLINIQPKMTFQEIDHHLINLVNLE
jgi:hypothetical protein